MIFFFPLLLNKAWIFFILLEDFLFFYFKQVFFVSQSLLQTSIDEPQDELGSALAKASMGNQTTIITIINKAYTEQDINANTTMFDLFLNSFRLGEGTRPLLDHVLVVAVDRTAYDRCRLQRLNCFRLESDDVDFEGEKVYMTEGFIKMMWKRTCFLLEVLKRGYNFVFTVYFLSLFPYEC